MKLFKHRAGARHSRSVAPPAVGLFLLALLAMLSFAGSALSAQADRQPRKCRVLRRAFVRRDDELGPEHRGLRRHRFVDLDPRGRDSPRIRRVRRRVPQLFNAQASLLTAYGFAEAQAPNRPTITGANLAGMTLSPGVYNSTSGILISGPIALTLDGGGDPNSVFIFQAASSGNLTVDPTSTIAYQNGAQPCNVFWKVNSAFLKNTDKNFVGTILALTQITLTEHITVYGRVLARNADVTFIHDVVNKPTCSQTPGSGPPPPGDATAAGRRHRRARRPRRVLTPPPSAEKKPVPPGKRRTPRPRPKPPVRSFGLTG